MTAILICLAIMAIGLIEILVPTLGFVIPFVAFALDAYIGFIIIRWIVERIESSERRRRKRRHKD